MFPLSLDTVVSSHHAGVICKTVHRQQQFVTVCARWPSPSVHFRCRARAAAGRLPVGVHGSALRFDGVGADVWERAVGAGWDDARVRGRAAGRFGGQRRAADDRSDVRRVDRCPAVGGECLHGGVRGPDFDRGLDGDRIGAKRVFLAGFGLFTLASAACGVAPTLAWLIAARAVQGVGAAVLVPCSLALLSHRYDDAGDRARAVGVWAAGASIALSAGPLVGGLLTATVGWRGIFFINVPIGLAAILICVLATDETPRQAGRGLDVAGALLAAVALATVAFSVISGGRSGFAQPLAVAGIIGGLVLAVGFVVVESRVGSPMLPLHLFRSAPFAAANGVSLLVNIAFYGLIFVLSLFFQHSQHLSALGTGLAFLPLTVAVLARNLAAARFVNRFGPGRVILAASGLMLVGVLPLVLIGAATPFGVLVVPFLALGAGLGLIVPAMTSTVLAAVHASDSGVASGMLNSARQTGSVLGVAVFGALGGGDPAVAVNLSSAVSAVLIVACATLASPLGRVKTDSG